MIIPRTLAFPSSVDEGALLAAFARARAAGIAMPGLSLGGFRFSPAPPAGRNAGAVYVRRGRTYLGKILYGRFMPVSDCDAATTAAVVAAVADPLAGAVAFGVLTGRCSCCSRVLTNEESVRLGIGPICRSRYFGGEDKGDGEPGLG